MTTFVIPAKKSALRQPGCLDHNFRDFRSMALRRRLSAVLPFGQPVGPDHFFVTLGALALRRRLLAVLLLSAVWLS